MEQTNITSMRILFASCHGYVDPSSGASISARQLLELMAGLGHDCRVLSTGILDYQHETSIEDVLCSLDTAYRIANARLGRGGTTRVMDLELGGVRVTLVPTGSSNIRLSPNSEESSILLDLTSQVLERFRPQVLLTYGGHPANTELMARAKRAGTKVVFFLRNLAYTDAKLFADTAGVLVASEFARRHYLQTLGLNCTVIPSPICFEQVVAKTPNPHFLTFINPERAKGASVFARIAYELNHRRPDIPLLVVEGRKRSGELSDAGLDLSHLRNLHVMANTPYPRDFYGVSRAILVPSLCQELFGRVAAEGLANGLPVLASDRGGLPEVLANAGFILPLPARCIPHRSIVPTAEEVQPWISVIERLWDDPAFESEQRHRSRAAALRWDAKRIAGEYERHFADVISA
jgi:glycosyltransferase involved in cell wall biosynthesis